MNDKEKAENCYRIMYKGMIDKDRTLLSQVLDDSFVLVHMTGMRQSKAAFIRAVEDGTLNYYSAEHQQVAAEINGEQAHLLGQSVVNAAVFGGGKHTWHLQLKVKLIKSGREDNWKITQAIASTY